MRVLFAAALLLAACAPTPHPDASAPAAETDRAAPPAPDEVGAFQERVSVDPAFAGLYLDPPRDRVVVMFTGDAAAHLARYTRDPRYVSRAAATPYAALIAAQEAVTGAMAQHNIHFMSASTNVQENRVEVDVVDADTARAALLRAGYTPPAYVTLIGRGGFVAEDQSRAPVTSFVQMRMPAGVELQALARGVLTLRDGCLRLGDGPESRLIVWPSSAVLEIEGRVVRVRDQRMHTSVTLGDTIEMGGGEGQALVQSALTAPTRCPGPYWGAASGWRRIKN